MLRKRTELVRTAPGLSHSSRDVYFLPPSPSTRRYPAEPMESDATCGRIRWKSLVYRTRHGSGRYVQPDRKRCHRPDEHRRESNSHHGDPGCKWRLYGSSLYRRRPVRPNRTRRLIPVLISRKPVLTTPVPVSQDLENALSYTLPVKLNDIARYGIGGGFNNYGLSPAILMWRAFSRRS